MTSNLWMTNTPQNFWRCSPNPSSDTWDIAIQNAIHTLGLPLAIKNIEDVLEYTLGEARLGKNRYKMGPMRCLYYLFKPLIPRSAIFQLRHKYNRLLNRKSASEWPIDSRYVKFQWEILRQLLILSEKQEVTFRYLWPQGKRFAFILTHDIETAEGQRLAPVLADMEETLGFHSMFNFVPELYPLDWGLVRELKERGFEIGVHGLKHDNKLFDSYEHFVQRSISINEYLRLFDARGFRAPLTIRNPEWMQLLDMEYDLSFFDTDPFEPIPGGVMSIWPFAIGRFTELPYTLPQDSTLYKIMGENSPRIWLEKIDFIEQYHGMALVIVHPDYSAEGRTREIYQTFLNTMRERAGYWHALPGEAVSWWKHRNEDGKNPDGTPFGLARAVLIGDQVQVQNLTSSDDFIASPPLSVNLA